MSPSFKTRIVEVDKHDPARAYLQEGADLLRSGELVAFPTETVYGLGANALDARAVAKIFAAKERPSSDPLIVHIYTLSQLHSIASNIPDAAWELARTFWPGPLTLILPKHRQIPENVTAGLSTVAVRMPNHRMAYELFKLADLAVVAPSANLFSRPSPTLARHVLDDLDGRIPLIIDAGATDIGVESTVLDLTGERPTILRPGGLPKEALARWHVGVVEGWRHSQEEAEAPGGRPGAMPSPGMMLKHYSPSVELLVFDGPADKVRRQMEEKAAALQREGTSVGLMVTEEEVAYFGSQDLTVVSLGPSDELDQVAKRLFAAMRSLEKDDVDVILTHTFERKGVGLAIWDRLLRATEGRIIQV